MRYLIILFTTLSVCQAEEAVEQVTTSWWQPIAGVAVTAIVGWLTKILND